MNSIEINCPHCFKKIHLIEPKTKIKINTAIHIPSCVICNEYDHTTKEHEKNKKIYNGLVSQFQYLEKKIKVENN